MFPRLKCVGGVDADNLVANRTGEDEDTGKNSEEDSGFFFSLGIHVQR